MKALILKELKLSIHPTVYIFLILAAMLLIPAYPYYVAFFYMCLAIFFIFLSSREDKDILFTASLPVTKREIVKARFCTIVMIELVYILLTIPFAVIGVLINPNPQGNTTGIEANVAFYGFVLMMFSVFHIVFLPMFYKTAYKVGKPFIISCIAMLIYVFCIEFFVVPSAQLNSFIDSTLPENLIKQIPVLIIGIGVYIICIIIAYQKSAKNFDKVDL